ncbi:MAG TPA: LamG domain-containing protein [Sedimentisphaerales bacterium]|nr:LamG domain-containing protein [Sedimentisphaerales bacterium]
MNKKAILIFTILALGELLISFSADAKGAEWTKAGLVGIQYGDEDFEKPEGLVTLSSLDQSWGQDDGFGKQWAGRWQGFIIGPASGDVEFTIETDQAARIIIGGKTVVACKEGSASASMQMVKGEKYPVVLTYVKEGSEYGCGLKVQWSWAGQAVSVIGGDNLVYSEQKAVELKTMVGARQDDDEDDGDGDGDGEDKKLSFSDLPAPVQATVKANLNGAVIDDIDSGTEDGKPVYEVDAKLDDGRELKLTILMDGTLYGKRLEEPANPKEKMLADGVIAPSSDTVALWSFDETSYPHTTLTDASEYAKADLCLMDGGGMVAGKYGNALKVTGSDYAVCYAGFAGKVTEEELRERDGTPSGLWGPTEGSGALLSGLAGGRWTVELWLNLSSVAGDISIVDMGQAYDPGFSLNFNGSDFELTNHYAGVKAVCPTRLSAGRWHHAAFTRDGSTVRHYLDGAEQTAPAVSSISVQPVPDLQKPKDREHESRGFEKMDSGQRRQNRFNFAIGTDRRADKAMKGMVDEMRISGIVRYNGNFTPESFSRNYGEGALRPSAANGPALLFDPRPVSIPLHLGARRHVFIDDAIIDKKENMQITMNQPYGKEQIIKDFKIKKSAWRPSVFDVDGKVFMAIPESYSSNEGLTFLATSPDGLEFTMKGKIIPETPMYGAFFKDLNPNISPAEQYKVNAFVANRGMYFYISADGLNWRRNETIQLPLRSGGGGECFWDDQRGTYLSYIKRDSSFRTREYPGKGPKGHTAPVFETNEILKPWPFKALEKPYFEGWPFPAVTGEGPMGFAAAKYGGVYRTRAIKYPWAPDVYLAFIWRYPGDDKARHVELAVSRNGRDWNLFGTNWYIPTGTADEELTMYGLIRRGDQIWQYVDEGGAHGGDAPRQYYRYSQRLDGFVSLDAGETAGTAATLPLMFEGNQLVLNIKATGWAKVAVTDEAGTELPGFALGDCDTIKADSTAHKVTWRASGDVSGLKGKIVRLKFQMQNAKLYAFEFKN